MKIFLVGMGMGREDGLTLRARDLLMEAEAVIGADRLLHGVPADARGERIALALPEQVAECIRSHPHWTNVCIALSGDPGFYSGARKLVDLLAEYSPEILCGISTPQYFAARLGRPWQDLHLVSAHGIACDPVAEILNHPAVLFLAGGAMSPADIARIVCEAGLEDASFTVGENLSSSSERIRTGTARAMAGKAYDPLAVVLVENAKTFCRPPGPGGLPDAEFIRGDVPMTKREVRAAVLALLDLRPDAVVCDIGAGTGSVAVEAALQVRRGRVYAVEKNPAACDLIAANRERFGVYNLRLVEGTAPGALSALPPVDSAFIGGSGGFLEPVVAALVRANPAVRIVVAAVTLETLARAGDALRAHDFRAVETSQIAVTRTRAVGGHTVFAAQNPVFLIAGGGRA
ncbi:MAG: precorrin-6y C5,15-methyltransferase (decarboxylating) subunit CbiE [Planctomycetaceae bacterium]|nr:precorrin-6y C5,15-methyltransferase (decarboxylating) subunit CbiE [Planctomycetaceae bacterium]